MASSAAATVAQYLASLPADRRAELTRVADVVRAHLPAGYEEGMVYGMMGWYIPLSRFPETYNGQPLVLAALAAQKNAMSLYMMTVYGDKAIEAKFRAGFKTAGKKLDMGKSCVRFKTADALALDVIGETIGKVSVEGYIATYQKARANTKTEKRKAAAKKQPAAKKRPATKSAKKR